MDQSVTVFDFFGDEFQVLERFCKRGCFNLFVGPKDVVDFIRDVIGVVENPCHFFGVADNIEGFDSSNPIVLLHLCTVWISNRYGHIFVSEYPD